jgi:hypothetical protein
MVDDSGNNLDKPSGDLDDSNNRDERVRFVTVLKFFLTDVGDVKENSLLPEKGEYRPLRNGMGSQALHFPVNQSSLLLAWNRSHLLLGLISCFSKVFE